jgi:hypothetical protein
MTRSREPWEFVSDDIQEPITMATIVTLDTLAPVLLELAKTAPITNRILASGWSYSSVDLGNKKLVDLAFTAPGDANEGFILRIKPSTFDANEIDTVFAYLFTARQYWYPSQKKLVLDTLKKGQSRPSTFEYSPQYHTVGLPMMTHSAGRPFDPEGVLVVLQPLVEALSSFNPVKFAECVSSHEDAQYQTLFPENQDILIATRGAMVVNGHLPGPALSRFVNFLWRNGMAVDLDVRMPDIDGLIKLLVNQGNSSKRKEYDFDDDKYGAYVKADGEQITVYFRHEKNAIAVYRSEEKLIISEADYKTGELLQTYVNISLEDGHVSKVHEAAPLRSHVTSLLRRWVKEIEGLGEMMAEAAPIAVDTKSP